MKVLLLFTGGTISMVRDPRTGALHPADMTTFQSFVPELFAGDIQVDMVPFDPLLDSSDLNPDNWRQMARVVKENYDKYDGFVILHGTDTMAFTASALSFMLEDLSKPVILTGSQLPIGKLRTDGKENLITAVEIAAAKNPDGTATVPEVCIFFENHLLRGNRTTKINAENFNAFRSYNYPILATAGIHIKYEHDRIHKPDPTLPLKPYYLYDTNVIVLTLFPGIQENIIRNILYTPGLRAVVLKTYGSGNAPQKPWFIKLLKEATERGIVIVNISQCPTGMVEMGRYETGLHLLDAGVISGYDSTVEALITKLMFLLGHGKSDKEIRELMNQPIAGEFTKA
jgi:L-asparaginase